MEEASDPIVIPGWIWVMVAMFAVGVIVALVIRRDRRSGRRSRGSRRSSNHSSGRSRHGHSEGRSSHRRTSDPFQKL